MSGSQPNSRSAGPAGRLSSGEEASNWQLITRMLRLAWRFRGGALKVILLQAFLLALALSGLGFAGLGVDVIHDSFAPAEKRPQWPFGLTPPAEWSAMSRIALIGGLIMLVASIRFFLDRTATVSKQQLVQDIVVHLRSRVYDKLQRLSFRFFDANETGSIINRVTGDVQGVRMFVDGVMIEVLMMMLSLAFFLTYMLSIHVKLTLVCLVTTPLLWVLTAWFSKRVRPAYRRNRELFDRAVLVLSENAQGTHVVKGFSLQQEEIQKFRAANDDVTNQQRWIFRQVALFVPLIGLIPQMNIMILLGYGGWLVINDPNFLLGSGLIVFTGLLQQFSNQVGNIAQIANSIQRSLTGAQRVFEILDTPLEIQTPEHPKGTGRAKGAVRFENVTFGYKGDEAPELHDISFHVDPGQTIAILGATGSGKSTLLSLIPRFYDPQHGRVLVDGIDVREWNLDDLRRNVGMVFQESFLFSQSVAENIAFGHPEATREQIEKAAKIAAAHEFIMELEEGYDTILSEAGGNLSGGQRQRLAIARAILLEPSILLLDDPTAAIDPETEHEILQAMDQAMEGRTTFVVAHRLSTLRKADQVIVLDKGQIVQRGTHEELIRTRGHYRHAARLQIADDESRRLLGIDETMEEATS